jgi:hypothetical protein
MMKKIYLLSAIVISVGLLGCNKSSPAEPKTAQQDVNQNQPARQQDTPFVQKTDSDEQKALQETTQKDTEDTSYSHQTAGPGITYEEYQKLSQIEPESNDINSDNVLSAEQIREMLKGMVFASEGEWRMGPNQEYRGRWGLAFMKDRPEFKWLDYDVEEEYGYSVLEDKKIITYEYGKTIEIPYDSNLTRIQWHGMWYRRVDPDSNCLSAEQIRTMLKGMVFESEGEWRMGPNQEYRGRWGLAFMKERPEFKWLDYDVEREYGYSVLEDKKIITYEYGKTIEIPYNSNLSRIQWKGMWYRRVDPDSNNGQ